MKNIKEPVQVRRLSKNKALTIPKQISEKLKLHGGDYVNLHIAGGVMFLTKNSATKDDIDPDEDLRKGRYKDFNNMEDLVNDLHN